MQNHPDTPVIGPDHRLPASVPDRRTNPWLRIAIWVLVLLVLGGALYLVLRHHDEAKTAASSRGAAGGTAVITTVTATQGNIGVYLDAIGTVTPVYTASISSQVNGIVTVVHYREGQYVQKGDPLIDIDSSPYRATLQQAEGALQRDQALLAQAQMDLQRYRDAWARNAIPRQTLEDQEKLVQQDEGTVKNDEGTVQYDQIQVDFCHITAPISGQVGLRLVDPGNVVQASSGTTLVVVTQIQPITVVFTIPEDNLGQVQGRTRQGAKLTVDAYDRTAQKKVATGTLIALDNQIDTTTGTVKGRATFANQNKALFPNEFVNTRLLVNTLQGATLVPSSAIQHNGQAAFVYVIQNSTAHMRGIQAGVTDGDTVQVTGINPGDVLADSSFDKLQDNTKVNVTKAPVPSSSNTGSGIGSANP